MLSRFHLIPERNGQTDRFAISISRVSMLTRGKNPVILCLLVLTQYQRNGQKTENQTRSSLVRCVSGEVKCLWFVHREFFLTN